MNRKKKKKREIASFVGRGTDREKEEGRGPF